MDSMGLCYFIGPSYGNMELIANALSAMYNLNLTRKDVINIGVKILKIEVEFNQKAGITQDTNDVPDFFKTENSKPHGLTFSFEKSELKNFWNRLEHHEF